MNVNDLICVGAEPVAMVDFILCERADPRSAARSASVCAAGPSWPGSRSPAERSAQVGEIVNGWELGGTAIGTVALAALVTGESIEPGDAVLGLPSSGSFQRLHTRAAGARRPRPAEDPDGRLGRPLGDVLLEPTEIYVRAVLELLRSEVDVRGLAHITGDGLRSLARLAAPVGYEIDDPLPVPPIFDLIRELGEVADDEMYEVFNMGCGFCCVVGDADASTGWTSSRAGIPAPGGTVTPRAGLVERR